MKDKDDLDDLFDFGRHENDLIKKARRKSTIRMVLTSGLVSLLVLALIVLIKLQVTPWLLDKELAGQEAYYDVYGANLFVGPWEETVQLIGSGATAPTYKLLDGRPVYVGDITNDSDRFDVYLTPNEFETYRYHGGKVMNFVHPGSTSEGVPNDLQKVDGMADNQMIEMGLSFDRAYTLNEVKGMLPADLEVQWVWVDVYTAEEVDAMNSAEPASYVFTENEVVGFSLVDETGIVLDAPVERFMESLSFGKDHSGPYKKEMQELYDELNGQDETDLGIIGAVVVGEQQALQQLKNESNVRASSIGAIVDSLN